MCEQSYSFFNSNIIDEIDEYHPELEPEPEEVPALIAVDITISAQLLDQDTIQVVLDFPSRECFACVVAVLQPQAAETCKYKFDYILSHTFDTISLTVERDNIADLSRFLLTLVYAGLIEHSIFMDVMEAANPNQADETTPLLAGI